MRLTRFSTHATPRFMPRRSIIDAARGTSGSPDPMPLSYPGDKKTVSLVPNNSALVSDNRAKRLNLGHHATG